MSFDYSQKYYNFDRCYQSPRFGNATATVGAPLSTPVEAVQKTIETGVDSFVKTVAEEKEKKSNKKALAVGSSVLVLGSLVALLNPRYSPKVVKKLKTWQEHLKQQVLRKDDSFIGKINKFGANALDYTMRAFNFCCNLNSAKDMGFKYLCTDTSKNIHIKGHKMCENFVKKADNIFVKIFKKPHEKITMWFDNIAQKTVKKNYAKALKDCNYLDGKIKELANDLPLEDKKRVEELLSEIFEHRKYYSDSAISSRLKDLDTKMESLEQNVLMKWKNYRSGFGNKFVDKKQHIDKNLSFWAGDVLATQKQEVEANGLKVYEALFGDGIRNPGKYNEIFDILFKNSKEGQKELLEGIYSKVSKKMKKARIAECFDYFDKKRDLKLGGAPTDIVTAVTGLGLCGAAVATAEDKEKRISRLITTGIPVVVGVGTSLVLASMLTAGGASILYGFASSILASKLGSTIDKKVFGNDIDNPNPTNGGVINA